ncbi:Protocadherin gamma-A2 [Plecturocebus cupreus]
MKEMVALQKLPHCRMLVLLCFLLATLWEARAGQILYSVREEIDRGSFVGNITKDLGLEPLALAERGVHIISRGSNGSDPVLSGTSHICMEVLDVNDNAPVFTQPKYCVSVPENMPMDTRILTVTATDADEGYNPQVAYFLEKSLGESSEVFELKSTSGDLKIIKDLDHEDATSHEIDIEAQDGPGLLTRMKVIITILDLEKSVDNYYQLVTTKALDREQFSFYNITLTAKDEGNPSLSTDAHILLQMADINDNAPAFSHTSYSPYIPENKPRGASIFSVTAHDLDSNNNGHITYSFVEDTIQEAPLSSYISINSDTGVLYALCSFDYEFQNFQLQVIVQDSRNPPLSSNVSLSLFVLDQNDNETKILYPALPTDGSTSMELTLHSAEPGYLVTNVVVVDRDSSQNA